MANRWVLRLPVCTILTLAALAFLSLLLPFRHFIASKASYLVIPLRNQVCPQTSLVDVQFSDHAAFQNLSHRYDRIWQDLVTPNGGFFFEKSPAGQVTFYGISMFHQLHCLGIIRSALQQAIPGHAQTSRDEAHHHGDHQDLNHMLHCVDYIRQVVLCYADDTIEDVTLRENGDPIVTGLMKRQCRDAGPLYEKAMIEVD